MALLIIHGDDQIRSRQELQARIAEAKRTGSVDIVRIDGKSVTLDMLIQNVESQSFFAATSRLTIIENLHKMRSKTVLKEALDYLATQQPETIHAILWEDHELSATQLKKLPTAHIIATKIAPVIFKLTDSLKPRVNLSTCVKLLNQACASDSAEMVLIMCARQLRLMIQTFDPHAKMAPWQQAKLSAAAKGFGLETLIGLHHELAEIDLKNKTGALPVDLKSELEMWLTHLTRV